MSVGTVNTVQVENVIDLLRGEYDANAPKLPSAAVIVAHHDDEITGMGAQFLKFGQVYFIHVTDGAPRDMIDGVRQGYASLAAYASARQKEFVNAMQIANIDQNRIIDIGIADQEASLNMPYIVGELSEILIYLGTQIVFTHPFEGGHPDHDATVLATRAAVKQIAQSGLADIAVFEFTSYFNDNGSMATGKFAPGTDKGYIAQVTPEQLELKVRMLECFHTQKDVLKYFAIQIERFRKAAPYFFTKSLPTGTYYDNFDWGVKSWHWHVLATEALSQLKLEEPL